MCTWVLTRAIKRRSHFRRVLSGVHLFREIVVRHTYYSISWLTSTSGSETDVWTQERPVQSESSNLLIFPAPCPCYARYLR